MSSPFLPGSSSSSASSPLSYLIPRPPPAPFMMAQSFPQADNGEAARQGGRPPLPRPPPRQCPRCRSANTKFCYYNNYSRSQPRYLCKACRRHWTEGGTLRDVPVGGGRKNKRAAGPKNKASTTASAAAPAQGSSGGADGFPDILRQMLFQPAFTPVGGGGGGYSIDLDAWQQTAPQGAGDAGAAGGAPADANCGGVQFWSGWHPDDMPGSGAGGAF